MKRLLLLILSILFLAGCSMATGSIANEKQVEEEDTNKETAAAIPLPLDGKTVILDPGHGGIDPGAVANDLQEKDLNVTVTNYTKQYLENQGAKVVLTRTIDEKTPFDERVSFSQQYEADIFVSIHHNTNEITDVHGTEVYYNETAYNGEVNPFPSESRELAQLIVNKLSRGGDLKSLGTKDNDYYVLRKNTVPSVIVEVAFVTNEQDAERLKDENNLQLFGELIGEGIYDYLIGLNPDQYANN